MMKKRFQRGPLLVALVGLLGLTAPACVILLPLEDKPKVHGKHAKKERPPPWAPAHGYRRKHHKHDLVFDAKIGVYVVVDLLGHYFYRDRFYKRVDGQWWTAARITSGWTVVGADGIPPGLRGTKLKGPKKHRGRSAPAKHGH